MSHIKWCRQINHPLVRVAALWMVMVAAEITAADIITTVVGGGNGDGYAATNARVERPLRAITDSSGNIYFTEQSTKTIRKITVGTGIITTIAGNGGTGSSGMGGLAINAELSHPCGLAFDAAGNLYVSDRGNRSFPFGNHRICKIDLGTGIITVVAGNGNVGSTGDGGPAINASFNWPSGIAFNAAGDLYISDQVNHRIRKVVMSGPGVGTITTVAGNGTGAFGVDGVQATSTSLYEPNATAFNTAGDMFIADELNHRVRKVIMIGPNMGVISTVVGTGTAGFSGDSGQASAAMLDHTGDLCFDPNGDLYIADAYNKRLRVVAGGVSTGVISTKAGGGAPSPTLGDGGQAIVARMENFWSISLTQDAQRNMVMADYFNGRIRLVTRATGVITSIAGNGIGDGQPPTTTRLRRVMDVAFDAAGNQFVVDEWDSRVRRVDVTTGAISTVAGNGLYGFSGDGASATLAQLNYPESVVVDSLGNLYIADRDNRRVRKVVLGTGAISTYAGTGGTGPVVDGTDAIASPLSDPTQVALDGAGNLLIANYCQVHRVNRTTGKITTIAGDGSATASGDDGQAIAAGLGPVKDLCYDGAGNLLIAALGLRKVTAGGVISTINPSIVISGLAVAPNGRIYASIGATAQIVEVDPISGATTPVAGDGTAGFAGDGSAATAARMNAPSGLAVDGAGRLYIADATNARVRRVTFAPVVFPGGGGGGGASPPADGGGSCGVGGGAAAVALLALLHAFHLGFRRRRRTG